MHFSAFSLLPLLALADVALSICPGFNYAVGNVQPIGSKEIGWFVYDDSCNLVDKLVMEKHGNPCTSSMFGCSPPPLHINKYTSSHTKLIYDCRPDPKAGNCATDLIAVCCRNDGH
ncbi:hypothetical protein BDN72DRAFT_960374 [Pluteus cervinus]|uniref:Uncharacterized protein n=1 Tax=Pluteus cervinus TaxID=181527 RepID=A0ACD3AR64_9AGAR|nr:hypothetical protein BDN72DRAFT_960374 [Pluteus cervinus]